MSGSYDAVEKLLGDFFERNTAGDKEGAKAVVEDIKKKLKDGEFDSAPFKEYFNNQFAGRGAANVTNIFKDYPRESIVRELLQNCFGCDYDEPNIKIKIEFLDEGQVKLIYNETGFNLEQVFYYLSVGRNDGDKKREGRFGVGAKSVFSNVDWFKMRSNDYSLRVVNDEGTLKVRELELNGEHCPITEIVFALPLDEQKTLHENLISITSAKGSYINMVDLCFAFIRKKNLHAADEEECTDRTFNIAIINYGKPEVVYKIQQYRKNENDIPKVRFSENGKSVADFIYSENDGFVYLIPYAISGAKREAAKVLMSKYNYFSTFELTGFVNSSNQKFVEDQLSAFFVSVPNKYITNNRSGIKYDSLEECSEKIEQGILATTEEYKRLFVLDLSPRQDDPERYTLRPNQYVFEFFYNYINNSSIVKGLREKFSDSVSVVFPHSGDPVLFSELREKGFFTERDDVTKEDHEDGTAAKQLYADIEQMNAWYNNNDNHVLVAKYQWSVAGTDEGGEEFLYSFYRDGNQYFMSSDGKKAKDYELAAGFKSIIALKLSESIINGQVADEDALEKTFNVIDEMFGENYRISMKYFQLVVTSGTAKLQFEISKINIGNLKKAYDTLQAHEMRFENHQIFNQISTLMVNSFTNGKDTIQFLKEIKSQGGDISLALDINKRYRFSVYGKQFMIPPNISTADLLDIVGDVYALIESGLLNNRVFDFVFTAGRFSFDTQDVMSALPSVSGPSEIESTLAKMYVCDLSLDKFALLDADNKLKKIVDLSTPITAEDKEKAAKFVVLRDGMSKPHYADFVEFLLTGERKGRLRALYSGTEEPNLVLIDQLPYYYKPVPTINRAEFDYLRDQVKRIAPLEKSNPKALRNYFARDVNAKLYGYGGVCPCCGYETGILNSFEVKKFSIGLMNGEKEQKFNFSLYLCHNDAAAAAGWLIDDVSIGGMTPFRWLDEISQIDHIPPEFLYCRIKYRRQISYDICEPNTDGTLPIETVFDGTTEVFDAVLSPMMAAKWFEDNNGSSVVHEDNSLGETEFPDLAVPEVEVNTASGNDITFDKDIIVTEAPPVEKPKPAPQKRASLEPMMPDAGEQPKSAPSRPAPQKRASLEPMMPETGGQQKPAAQRSGREMKPRYPAPEGVTPRNSKPKTEPMG
ncbi:MAG: hypothetical protein K2J80_12815 [Oscillospiraceae bacterium]|nr:hypothetical protein [Oscillospiraceae bacterium]